MLKLTVSALIVTLACSLPAVAENGRKPGSGKRGKGNTSQKSTSQKKRDPAEFFKHHDKNNDGKLSLDEMKSKKGGDDTKRAEHFKKLDKNGDGFVTMAELTARSRKK